MFLFGSAAASSTPEFVPNQEARSWIAENLVGLYRRLDTTQALFIDSSLNQVPRNLDGLFDLICAVQEEIGQADVEFSLREGGDQAPGLPAGFTPLGNPQGHLLHTFVRAGEYVIVYLPQLFRVPELLFAAVARELGRIGLDRVPRWDDAVVPDDREGVVELASVTLGMGVWVANGAYVFEQGCCGGGCGVDLRSVRAGLSLPEACFGLALDGHRRRQSRRAVGRYLAPTQRAALKSSWKWIERHASDSLALVAGGSAPTTALPSQ